LPRAATETEPTAILITAGFPCQPFSVAGKRGSKDDDRYLWPETLAVIKAVKPKWVLLENVAGIIPLALDDVLSDLEGEGYAWETVIVPACAVNAWHRRDRVWVVAHANVPDTEMGENDRRGRGIVATAEREGRCGNPTTEPRSQDVADTEGEGLEGADTEGSPCRAGQPSEYGQGRRQADWWATQSGLGRVVDELPPGLDGHFDREPDIPRVATGVKDRVSRLKALGNAIVPAVAFEIIRVIKEIEG